MARSHETRPLGNVMVHHFAPTSARPATRKVARENARLAELKSGAKVSGTEGKRSSSPPSASFGEAFLDAFRYAPSETHETDGKARPAKKLDTDSSSDTATSSSSKRRLDDRGFQRDKLSLARETKEDSTEDLPEVPDHVKDDMDVLFIGSNPGRMSSQKGQHFGHPSNHFYRTLHGGGFTPQRISPAQDYTMLDQKAPLLSLGLTNLAPRPTRLAEEVSATEHVAGAAVLIELIRRHRPRTGIFVGLGVARAFEQASKTAVDAKVLKDESGSARKVRSPLRIKTEENVAEEPSSSRTLFVPKSVPLASDKELGLGVGLLPIAVQHGEATLLRAQESLHVKKEDIDEDSIDGALRQRPLRQPSFTLLYACPSTSGRVTTHQLPQKTEVMKRGRLLAEYLARLESGHESFQDHESSEYKAVQIRLI